MKTKIPLLRKKRDKGIFMPGNLCFAEKLF